MPSNSNAKHYMTVAGIDFQYREAKQSSSLEYIVIDLWRDVLRQYFRSEDGYLLQSERHISNLVVNGQGESQATGRSDVCVARIHRPGGPGLKRTTFLVLEGKRAEGTSQDLVWDNARDQALSYAQAIRSASDRRTREQIKQMELPMYVLVAVGTWLRVYIFDVDGHLRDFDQNPVKFMELMKNEERIHGILTNIRQVVETTFR